MTFTFNPTTLGPNQMGCPAGDRFGRALAAARVAGVLPDGLRAWSTAANKDRPSRFTRFDAGLDDDNFDDYDETTLSATPAAPRCAYTHAPTHPAPSG